MYTLENIPGQRQNPRESFGIFQTILRDSLVVSLILVCSASILQLWKWTEGGRG